MVNNNFAVPQKWETDIQHILENAASIVPSVDSGFAELILGYLDFCSHHKDMTLKSIQHEMRYTQYFFDWVIKEYNFTHINQIISFHIKAYIDYLNHKNYSVTSIRHHFVTMKHFFAFLVESKIVKSNPTKDIRIKAVKSKPRQLLTIGQRDLLLKTLVRSLSIFIATRDKAILHLVVCTGIRLQEIPEIKISDLNLPDKSLTVRGKGSRSFTSKVRTVYIDDTCEQALNQYLKHRENPLSPWLFIGKSGMRLSPVVFQQLVAKHGKLSGIDVSVNFRILRASFASWMVEKGIDPVALKQLMGHENIRTTFGCYVFMTERHVRKTWQATNPLSKLLSREVLS